MDFSVDLSGFILDSLIVIVAWLLLASSFHSWGRFVARILGITYEAKLKHFNFVWMGFAFSIFFFAVYNLFWPINWFCSTLFYIPGLIVFIIKDAKSFISYIKSNCNLSLLAIVLTCFVASTISIQLPMNFDTGLYHFNSIRWLNEFPIIKGIGNLHGRLGFNQFYFLYVASLNFHPLFNDFAYHVANSFLYALFCSEMIVSETFVDLILLALFFFLPMPNFWIATPTPDIAVSLLQMIIFKNFIVAVSVEHCCERWKSISFVALLSALIITIKLSSVFFVLGLLALVFIKKYPYNCSDLKIIKTTVVYLTLFIGLWFIRGYMQTGYPLFPSSIGRINFDWTVAKDITERTERDVYVFAKLNNYDHKSPLLKDWAWFDPWLKESYFNIEQDFNEELPVNISTALMLILFPMTMIYWGMGSLTLFCCSIIFIIIWLVAIIRRNELWRATNTFFGLTIIELISIFLWFFIAPNPRFSNAIFNLLFVTSLLLLKKSYPSLKINKYIKNSFLFYSFFIFIWCFYINFSNNEFRIGKMIVLKKIQMLDYITDSGLKLLYPINKSQCWDSDLPSTPEPDYRLELRGISLEDGFRIKSNY